ncbi:lipid-A-disaccharide kinase [Marinicella litoralis]|uniref:Tetraacyldisaccharide 4'-kinase n=2 Tax=Marinicella litoralis TaxID=644220 RepID=A0A4R6Y0A7_9GAMM|nr:lipid-A-disaccharide kinase [Marinicella litoralis]
MAMNENKIRQRWYGGGKVGMFAKMAAALFSFVVSVRSKLFQWGVFKTHQLKVPVIIVGNITAGGGGKTPMVIWLTNHLKSLGYKPGIVSRGYGGTRKVEPMYITPNANPLASGDEPLLMAKRTQLPVMVGKDRVKAAKALIKNYSVNVVVSDDGMQHLALGRDAEIVMLDAKWRTGNHLMMPAGPLREPLERLNSVDLVVFKGKFEGQHHYELAIDCIHQLNHAQNTKDSAEFRNQKVVAMAGIANPNGFFSLLSNVGMAIIKHPLPDHHNFTATDFKGHEETMVLITEKDAVKCESLNLPNVWVVKVKAVIPATTVNALNQIIDKVMK